MPSLESNEELQSHQTGNFGYSAAKLNTLGATEYTLVTLVSDVSGSVASFKKSMEEALKEAVRSCFKSPRADNLLLRHLVFGDRVEETMGFTLLSSINADRFDDCLQIQGSTALNDGVINALLSTGNYAEKLYDADFTSNGLIIVITDGCNNASYSTEIMIKDAIGGIRTGEKIESLAVVVVGVNVSDQHTSNLLKQWIDDIGLDIKTDYVELKDANASTLARLAKFISHSISSTSQALGTGGPSKQLTSGSLQQSLVI